KPADANIAANIPYRANAHLGDIGSLDGAKSGQPVRRVAQRNAAHRAIRRFFGAATRRMG
ncbi:MAG: hypothetical protein AAGC83_10645, partial [Pseudomonadota bacterium]